MLEMSMLAAFELLASVEKETSSERSEGSFIGLPFTAMSENPLVESLLDCMRVEGTQNKRNKGRVEELGAARKSG